MFAYNTSKCNTSESNKSKTKPNVFDVNDQEFKLQGIALKFLSGLVSPS